MPKLGLGINLANSARSKSPLTLYQDNFIYEGEGAYTFTTRQFFSTPGTGSVSLTPGILSQQITSTGLLIVAFEAAKDQYSPYTGRAYEIGEKIYGGVYGHGVFEKTGPGAGGGSGGFPPIMRVDSEGGSVAGLEDVNGWTRIPPPNRVLQNGETLKITFDYKVTTTSSIANNIRFGVFNIPPYITGGFTYPAVNNDYVANQPTYLNQGTASVIYFPASGYAFQFGKSIAYGGIFRRNPNSSNSLINTTANVYTGLQTGVASSSLSINTYYPISIRIKREGSSLRIVSKLPNAQITTVDASPTSYSFNSFAVYGSLGAAASHTIKDMKVEFGTMPASFINQITVSNGSYSEANGTYTRNNNTSSFTKTAGTPCSIFFSDGIWYINASIIGNVAQNTSELGTGTWTPLAPGSSSGITATYAYSS